MSKDLKFKLTAEERFRLRFMYAYEMEKRSGKVNVRRLCLLFGIGKSTFYKWKKRYKPHNLYTIQTHSRRPKNTSSIPWSLVIEICGRKRRRLIIQKHKRKDILIQRIQTDNGLEFQLKVLVFLAKQQIKHQYTWIHTPDQNGVVKRTHRTDD